MFPGMAQILECVNEVWRQVLRRWPHSIEVPIYLFIYNSCW